MLSGVANRLGLKTGANFPGTHFRGAADNQPQLRWWKPTLASADREYLSERATIVARARELDRNNAIITSARRRRVNAAVGSGWHITAQVDGAALGFTPEDTARINRRIEQLWREYATSHTFEPDAQRQLTFGGLLRTAARSLFIDGEAFGHLAWSPREACSTWATRLDIIDTDRVSNPDGAIDEDTRRAGIELDPNTRAPIAYYVRERHPNDVGVDTAAPTWRRIPRWTPWGRPNFLHVYDRDRPGQTRGLSNIVAALSRVKGFEKYDESTLANAALQAMMIGVVKSNAGPSAVSENFGVDDLRDFHGRRAARYGDDQQITLDGGINLPVLPPEDELQLFTQGREVASFEAYMRTNIRLIAACVGSTYEETSMDYSTTNYSSMRAAFIPQWQETLTMQTLLRDQMAQPFYVAWLEEAIETGRVELPLDAPDFWDNLHAYTRCRWITPGKGYIDATKEIQATAMEMENLLLSPFDAAAEQGRDLRDIVADHKRYLEWLAENGLTAPAGGVTLAAASAPQVVASPDARPSESAA
ncbi:MAG TPA: phage portal protein [Terricaulis sp.]|nr:phage portal protein [Terricaulis sp.]